MLLRRMGVVITSALLFVSCIKTCVGVGELGSKERPAVIALEGWPHTEDSIAGFDLIKNCLEEKARYRVALEIHADVEAVAETLLSGGSIVGVMYSSSFVTLETSVPLAPVFMPVDTDVHEDRSVIIGPDPEQGPVLQSKTAELLAAINGGVIAYLSQSSVPGFLVGRHLLYEMDVLPGGAVFTSDWTVTVELVRQGQVHGGVVSESYLRSLWGVQSVVPGDSNGGVVVLAVSPPLPGRVIVAHEKHLVGPVGAIIRGLEICAAEGAAKEAVALTFGGTQFQRPESNSFEFLRRVHQFQEVFVRILPEVGLPDPAPQSGSKNMGHDAPD